MLGGMAALPGPDWTDEPIRVAPPLGHITHVFTHFRLELAIVSAPVAPSSEGWWQPVARLDEAGLPSLYKRAAESVLASRNALAA
jgi:A/G-specific adenine glycosylase